MSGHGANPIFFNKKWIGRPEHSLPAPPLYERYHLICALPPTPQRVCNLIYELTKGSNKFVKIREEQNNFMKNKLHTFLKKGREENLEKKTNCIYFNLGFFKEHFVVMLF